MKSIQHAKTEMWKDAFVTDLKYYQSTFLEVLRDIMKFLSK
jgi:hypothetical protein